MAFRRYVFVRDFSNEAIVKIAFHTSRICNEKRIILYNIEMDINVWEVRNTKIQLTCTAFLRCESLNGSSGRPPWQRPVHKWCICSSFRHYAVSYVTKDSSTSKMIHHRYCNEMVYLVAELYCSYVHQ